MTDCSLCLALWLAIGWLISLSIPRLVTFRPFVYAHSPVVSVQEFMLKFTMFIESIEIISKILEKWSCSWSFMLCLALVTDASQFMETWTRNWTSKMPFPFMEIVAGPEQTWFFSIQFVLTFLMRSRKQSHSKWYGILECWKGHTVVRATEVNTISPGETVTPWNGMNS